jgi:hypothetical protein
MLSSERSGLTARFSVFILLALPFLLLLINRNWPFQDFGDTDAFIYFGHFQHFPRYQILRPTYAGERTAWIIPGYALVHLFGPVYGTLALHFAFYELAVLSLFWTVTRFAGTEAGFLCAAALGIHPYFLSSNGTDYVMGGLIGYSLATFALLVRAALKPSRWTLLFAGFLWAAVVFTYPLWLAFTPACALIYLAPIEKRRLKSLIAAAIPFAVGFALLGAGLFVFHRLVFGTASPGFFEISLSTARYLNNLSDSLWAARNFSVTYADWLVFPGAAAGLSLLILIPAIRRWLALPPATAWLAAAYLWMAAVMVIMTLRPARYLEFDYFATFLIPGTFLVLGVSFFRIPHSSNKPLFWPLFWIVLAAAIALAIAPLAKPGLYVKPPILGAVVPGLFLALAVSLRLLRPQSRAAIIPAAFAMAASCYCLAPAVGGIAWRDPRDWMAAQARIAESVRIIETRLPRDQFPAFWYPQSDPNGLEFHGIAWSFGSHMNSMPDFPAVNSAMKYSPGQILILVTAAPGAFEIASSQLPLSLLWKQQVASGSVHYWLTATQVQAR